MNYQNKAEEIAQSVVDNLCETKEYLYLADFLIIASDVSSETEQFDKCTVFRVHKVYGRKSNSTVHSICLFNSNHIPTVGLVSESSVQLFQDHHLGRLRLSYLPQPLELRTIAKNPTATLAPIEYYLHADISTDGKNWKPFISGVYK